MNKFYAALLVSLSMLAYPSIADDNNQANNSPKTTIQMPIEVNINQADVDTLTLLKGIGKAKAQAIISYREQHGKFTAVEDLMKIKGIGEKIVLANKDQLKI